MLRRLTYDEREAEERVFVEAITNQYESKEALTTGGMQGLRRGAVRKAVGQCESPGDMRTGAATLHAHGCFAV